MISSNPILTATEHAEDYPEDTFYEEPCERCKAKVHCVRCFGCNGTHALWCGPTGNPRYTYYAMVYDPNSRKAFFLVKEFGIRLYAQDFHFQRRAA